MTAAVERDGEAQRALLSGDVDGAQAAFARAAELYQQSWELAPDHLTWTFHLRKGAGFSDGHPITADDVLFSFAIAYDDTLHPPVQDLLKVGGRK